jgi:hypothetical protein
MNEVRCPPADQPVTMIGPWMLRSLAFALSQSNALFSSSVIWVHRLGPCYPASNFHRRTWRRLVGEKRMEMHTPSKWTFWLSLALVVLAIASELVNIPFVSKYALWVAVVGYVVLVIGCTVKTT